jgi:branched-subunit amino acid ABC-type transport system permease component
MRGLWIGVLIILLAVGAGLIFWLRWPWNLAVGLLVLIKLSVAFALFRALGRMGQRRSS